MKETMRQKLPEAEEMKLATRDRFGPENKRCVCNATHYIPVRHHTEPRELPAGTLPKVVKNGYIAELRRARKGFECAVCKEAIEPGHYYYSVVMAGGGLGWLKFPDRCHIDCLNQYLERGRRD